jgi:HD-like signal output (HDOD) protein
MTSQSPGAPSDSIGESVFRLPRFEKLTVPAPVGKFFSDLARLLVVPATSRAVLKAFAGIDVKAERVAELIRSNPALEFLFMRNVQALAKRETVLHLESAVVLFGMQNTRNWLVGLQLHRRLRGAFPDFDSEGKLLTQPSELVKFAVRAEDAFFDDRDGYADTAYLAGLHFDLLGLAASRIAPNEAKVVHAYLEELYAEGLTRAQMASKLARGLPNFVARKYLFSACLLSDVGKAVLCLLAPDYLKFVEACGKVEVPRTVRMQAEFERFGTTHAVLSAWVVELAGLLKPLAPALGFHHDPILLRGRDPGMYELASLVSLASVLAKDSRKPASPEDPMIDEWLTPDLGDLGVTRKALVYVKA